MGIDAIDRAERPGPWRYGVARFALAVVAVALASLLKLLLHPILGVDASFLLFFAAVVLAAWFGGLGPGLLATGGSVAATAVFVSPPLDGFFDAISDRPWNLAIFILEAGLISALAGARRRAETERARLLERERQARADAERAERRSAFLAEASRVLGSSLEYTTTLQAMARLTVAEIAADWCFVDVAQDDGSIERLAVAHRDPERVRAARELSRQLPHDPARDGGVPAVIRTGEAQLIAEITDEALERLAPDGEQRARLRDWGFASAMLVPLVARGRTLGALSLVSAESGRRYGRADLSLAQDLARRAAMAVDNARLYQQASETTRAREEFLATLSHELRTPLTAMLGWVRLLRTGHLDGAAMARGLETIERNMRRQAQLTEDLLDVSRIVTGRLHLDVRPLHLGPIIQAAVDVIRPAANAKRIRLEVSLDSSASAVEGDRDRLQQVVWNLLSNAIKFASDGALVRVRLERAGSDARIIVRDTGEGIPAELLPHIFDRFWQGEAASGRRRGGLGLGLTIVRYLVEMHGGTVHAESDGRDQGAVFTVVLPGTTGKLRPSGFDATPEIERPQLPCAPSLDGVRVVVVEEEQEDRALLATVLAERGATVTAVGSAAEAVARVVEDAPDVLVSDLDLPDDDGYGLIRRIRGLDDGRCRRIPAVAITAPPRLEDRVRLLAAGYQMHVAKPIEPADLVTVVANLAGRTF